LTGQAITITFLLSDIAWTPCPVAGRICRVERRGVDPANMRSVLNIVMDAADAP
jgi:hypothetical protein